MANKLMVSVPARMYLATASYACLLYNEGASREGSRVRRADGSQESSTMTAWSQGRCHPDEQQHI